MSYALLRPALFALEPELSHRLTLRILARAPALASLFAGRGHDLPATVCGLSFRNRVGLAAGLDKDGECLTAWDAMGFGFVEVGTVTPRPQPGNPAPRLFRLTQSRALINRLGFNNHGVDALVTRVRQARLGAVLGINIGKNADTPLERAADDYVTCLEKVYPHAGYVTVNISSPNTQALRDLQRPEGLVPLLERLGQARRALEQEHGKSVPLWLKLSPDAEPRQLAQVAALARENGADALVVSNTTVSRSGVEGMAHASEAGGLSGEPLKPLALAALRAARSAVGADFPIVGVGGILTGADARERMDNGADLVQVYTGLIYRGPRLVAECRESLS